MKRFFSLCIFLFSLHSSLFAQREYFELPTENNLILFTEDGEKFQIVLNGIVQNVVPETNIKLTELPAPSYKCRIIFSNTQLGILDFNLYFHETGEELTMLIKQNNSGEYVTRYVSSIPISQAPPDPQNQVQFVYSKRSRTETSTTTTVSQTTTTHSISSKPDSDEVNVHMRISDGTISNVNPEGIDLQNESTPSGTITTTTTTTRTVTKTSSSQDPITSNTDLIGYSGPIGCSVPMRPEDFSTMKTSIASTDFESTRLSIAKQALGESCLLANQVREVLSLFVFENTKLEYAKFAYGHTYDIGNYYQVNDAFEFESSVEELDKFISLKE